MKLPLICLFALVGSAAFLKSETLPVLRESFVPQTLDELWTGFDPKVEDLATEITREWEQDGIICRVVRYHIGSFKGQRATMAAFYAFPKGSKGLPALLHIHGGGQSANLANVLTDAKRGYASLSLNWGGNKMLLTDKNIYDGPGTDWGALDATHPPQRNPVNHFAAGIAPDAFTLDRVVSPRNDNWFLVTLAARRALTFLEHQPEVDPTRLGVYGHSMGGRLTTQLAGIDSRVRAAVPSCGGSGDLTAPLEEMPGGQRSKANPLELACVSENPYISRLTVPTLWLSPTNDFHAHMDNMAWNWRNVPDRFLRLSMSPHFNHRHADENVLTQHLWFEEHLKGKRLLPSTPAIALVPGRVPKIAVTPDPANPCKEVRIYYSGDTHELTRFWRQANAKLENGRWIADAPILDVGQPLFAFANVVYETPVAYRDIPTPPGVGNSATFAISSREVWATPSQLQKAGTQCTDAQERLIAADTKGWGDWYRLNWGNAELWSVHTRKVKDPKWRGPAGARLRFEISALQDCPLAVRFVANEWGAFGAGAKTEHVAVKELKVKDGWAEVVIELADLRSLVPAKDKLATWDTLTELSISPNIPTELRGSEAAVAKGWTRANGPQVRNLRWEGGAYASKQIAPATLSETERLKAFNESIKASLQQEKQDAQK